MPFTAIPFLNLDSTINLCSCLEKEQRLLDGVEYRMLALDSSPKDSRIKRIGYWEKKSNPKRHPYLGLEGEGIG